MRTVDYEEMSPGEEQAVCELIEHGFHELVAPYYEQEGVDEFFRFANAAAMAERVHSGSCVLVAKQSGKLVGVLELIPPNRIAMLFVTLRERGVGKELIARAIEEAKNKSPEISKMMVHASPNAESAYQRMGFLPSGNATTEHGIRYVPMELLLGDQPNNR